MCANPKSAMILKYLIDLLLSLVISFLLEMVIAKDH